MKKNTTITIDDGIVDSLHDLGFTLSGFTQTAVDVLLSEGFDEFALSLKLRLIEQEEWSIEEEIQKLESKIRYLRKQLSRNQELHKIIQSNYEESKRSVQVCKLVDELNNDIIMSGYDIATVEKKSAKVIEQITDMNPDFNLEKHITRIKKLVS